MALDQLLLFVTAGLLLNLTPGPDVPYIVTHALKSGARAGIVGLGAGAVRRGLHWQERAPARCSSASA